MNFANAKYEQQTSIDTLDHLGRVHRVIKNFFKKIEELNILLMSVL